MTDALKLRQRLLNWERKFTVNYPAIFPLVFPLLAITRKTLHAWAIFQSGGLRGIGQHLQLLQRRLRQAVDYQIWIKRYDVLTDKDREAIRSRIDKLEYKPLISIVMPVYNVEEKWLRRAIESVRLQLYPHWELCVADDNSTKPHIHKVLEAYATVDDRIKVVFRKENGHISAASNSALELAMGEFAALLDHDDELSEHALYTVAEELSADPEVDMIYSDEDMIDKRGHRFGPKFKPDWSPDLFYSLNLITHLSVYRISVLRKIGGFRLGVEGSQDYDLALRVVEQISESHIRHIPHILYHWRAIPGSVAVDAEEKPYAQERAREAIREHFRRCNIKASVSRGFGFLHRAAYPLPETSPLVQIILLAHDNTKLLSQTLASVLNETDYSPFEILVVVPSRLENQAAVSAVSNDKRVRFIESRSQTISALFNEASKQSRSPVICFLDGTTKIKTKGWLREMTAHALRPTIGAVGAKVLYQDGSIRHAGYILGIGGQVGSAHRGQPPESFGHLLRLRVIQNFSAISSSCMVTRRELFEDVGNFDETNFADAYGDVDYCLRLQHERGLRILWTPYAEVYQLGDEELLSGFRNDGSHAGELSRFREKWKCWIERDPYYNANLTVKREDFSIELPPRINKPFNVAQAIRTVPRSSTS
jgi:glycosyltransferase involved in cell wall biosynthesis